MAAEVPREQMSNPQYWRNLCPGLALRNQKDKRAAWPSDVALPEAAHVCADRSEWEKAQKRLKQDGFASLPPTAISWSKDWPKLLGEAAEELGVAGWPPTALCMYDECWELLQDVRQLMDDRLKPCLDVVGFRVDPGGRGFSPHRDRQPEDWMPRGLPASVSDTFFQDQLGKYVTAWMALTPARPENSCLFFVPAGADPGYRDGDSETGCPLQACFGKRKEAYTSIQAAPLDPGGVSFHTHRTIHWGSESSSIAASVPRISISFGFSDPEFEPPYADLRVLPLPPFKVRLALLAGQLINYATLADTDTPGWSALAGNALANAGKGFLQRMYSCFQDGSGTFHGTYNEEIARKFSSSTLGTARGSADDDSDAEDAALGAMLDAEAKSSKVLFHDDLDSSPFGVELLAKLSGNEGRRKGRRKKGRGAPERNSAKRARR